MLFHTTTVMSTVSDLHQGLGNNVCSKHGRYVCGVSWRFNISDHITAVCACSSGTSTNVLLHRNAMLQTQGMTPHPITLYRHRADQSFCYSLMQNVTLEYPTTHFNVLGQTRLENSSPTFHIHQRTFHLMMLLWL